MTAQATFRHWVWKQKKDDILHLTLDRADSSHNSLSREVLQELGDVVALIQERRPRAVVLRSAKPKSFIVGADVSEFVGVTDSAEVLSHILNAQAIFFRLEQLPMPTLAVIDGPCLGGGLELALACRYRLAVDDDATSLGFPEILLGIHPGFGGTVRSIRQLGALPALQLMLTGRSLDARQAQRAGLVDAAVPRRVVDNAVATLLAKPPQRKPLPWPVRLGNLPLLRPLLALVLKRKAAAKAEPKHYPAPFALIELWQKYADDPEQMYLEEARSVARLMSGSTAQNLVRVFFLQTRLKEQRAETDPIRRVHVIGAGNMGRDIASWCALQGLQVSLQDLDNRALASAISAADKLFKRKLKQPYRVRAAQDRLMADPDGRGLSRADLVIEAIVENAEVKKQLFSTIEPQMRPDAILASNTSSIPLEELAKGLQRPQQFLGIHFFNPVAQMPLVEIVAAASSADPILSRAAGFVRQIKHLPLPVKSAPGFLVNRILMPYLIAAVNLVEEGYHPEEIDRVALDFGMPMGPLHLADKVGLDICLSVAKVFAHYFERPVPQILPRMIAQGHLGMKSGQGFYRYHKGKKRFTWRLRRKSGERDVLLNRLLDPLLSEAEACLAEGIVTSADLVDAGMIFGTGFAPFTGGPLHYRHQSSGG